MTVTPRQCIDRFLKQTLPISLVALWFPLHNVLDIEIDSLLLDVVLVTILLALIGVAFQSKKKSALNTEELASDLSARMVELNFSHTLVSQIDIETRREVGVWLHGQVQSFHLSLARRMRSVDSKSAHELAEELDAFTENTIRTFAHRLYPPVLEVSLDLALSDLLQDRATYEISEALSSENFTHQNVQILPFRIRYILYRIVEECVANAEKKPLTKNINVELLLKHDTIEVFVTDDGGPVPTPMVHGLGMRLIKDYLASVDGVFNLTTFGPGARFTAQFQLRKKDAE